MATNNSRSERFRFWLERPAIETPFATSVIGHILTALLVSGAFTVSAFNQIGTGIVPLIDKGHFLAMISIYASGVYIGSVLYYKLVQALFHYISFISAIPSVIELRKQKPQRPYLIDDLANAAASLRVKYPVRFVVISVATSIFMIAAVGIWRGSDTYGLVYSIWQVDGAFELSIYTGALLILIGGYFYAAWTSRTTLLATISVFLSAMLVVTSLAAGSTWIHWVRDAGPRALIDYNDGGRALVAIAFPAIEGLIVFVDESDLASYIPWSRIKGAQPILQIDLQDNRPAAATQTSSASNSPGAPTSLK